MKTKNNVRLIYVYNLAEDAETLIAGMGDEEKKKAEIDEDLGLSDHELFIGGDNKILITSLPVNKDFIDYVCRVTGYRNIANIFPKSNNPNLCQAIRQDQKFLSNLIRIIKACRKPPIITSYASTKYFVELIRFLKSRNLNFRTPDLPELPSTWTRDFLGSKSGFRQFICGEFNRDRLVKMPKGWIASNPNEAALIASKLYLEDEGVVLKINRGHAGAGLKIYTSGRLPNDFDILKSKLLKLFSQDYYWKNEPIIIEKLIPVDWKVGGGSPNIELRIKPSGRVEKLYVCGMRITPEGVFQGVEAGNRALPTPVERKLVKIGLSIGKKYAKIGYRGSFEIDLVITKNGDLYCTESNLRKTGGTFIYDLGLRLFGSKFLKYKYVLSHNLFYHRKLRKMSFNQLKEVLKPILFTAGVTEEGLIITGVGLLSTGRFGYVIFTNSKNRAYQIEGKMIKILTDLPPLT